MGRTKSADPGKVATVGAFLDALDHPHKPAVLALRRALLGVDASISEEIKWNAPSFRTVEHFATMNMRAREGVLLILHLGAKKAGLPAIAIADPLGLLKWLGPDRASLAFRDERDVLAKGDALAGIVRQWIGHVRAC